jgi:hypothetical protein
VSFVKKILFIATMILFCGPVIAMTCVTQELKKRYRAADYVFVATVKERVKLEEEKDDGICWAKGESCGSKIATVNIGEVWKGEFETDTATVYSMDGCYCLGTYFEIGKKYIVFGNKSDKKATWCAIWARVLRSHMSTQKKII